MPASAVQVAVRVKHPVVASVVTLQNISDALAMLHSYCPEVAIRSGVPSGCSKVTESIVQSVQSSEISSTYLDTHVTHSSTYFFRSTTSVDTRSLSSKLFMQNEKE